MSSVGMVTVDAKESVLVSAGIKPGSKALAAAPVRAGFLMAGPRVRIFLKQGLRETEKAEKLSSQLRVC